MDERTREEQIRSVAYMIWEREGKQDGHALAHWVKATQIVDSEDGNGIDTVSDQNGQCTLLFLT